MKKLLLTGIAAITIFSAVSLRLLAGDISEPPYPVNADAQKRHEILLKHRIRNASNLISKVTVEHEREITVIYTPKRISDDSVWIIELFQAAGQILKAISKVTVSSLPNVTIHAEIRTVNMDTHERSATGISLFYRGDKLSNINWDDFSLWDAGEQSEGVIFHKIGKKPALNYCQTEYGKKHSIFFCGKLYTLMDN
ncbi:hypothetical protein NF675_14645 [Pseudomonas siliginis]|uniref:hypothetical protein n=1 Tax=Pseudomonas siliginis TaxID=2842346 RepID=UPI0020937655|nr:hypothetical protein [Pseudomonas siliginis]UST72262.1 hypothetical protein NF675_14645 [Pseudomonas siliginis]